MFKVKVLNKIADKGLDLFASNYTVSDSINSPDALLVRSAKVDTDSFENLLAVARAGAGVNNITIDKASAKGVCVFNTPGANANAVAELVMTTLGMAVRNVHQAAEWVQNLDTSAPDLSSIIEKGKSKFAGTELKGKTLGVIGLGKIGVLVANYARWKDMKTIAYEPYPSVSKMHSLSNRVSVLSNLDEVIASSDFLTIHVPFIKGVTENLLNAENLASFKGTHILNFARDGIVDMDAIYALLENSKLEAYVSDFPDAKQIAHKKIICAVMAVEQLRDYLEFGSVKNSVNFPNLEDYPHANIKSRIIVINEDVPNMIAEITKVIGSAGINIASFSNKSNGKIGYNLIDIEQSVDASILKNLDALPKVIKVRLIHF